MNKHQVPFWVFYSSSFAYFEKNLSVLFWNYDKIIELKKDEKKTSKIRQIVYLKLKYQWCDAIPVPAFRLRVRMVHIFFPICFISGCLSSEMFFSTFFFADFFSSCLQQLCCTTYFLCRVLAMQFIRCGEYLLSNLLVVQGAWSATDW